MQDKVWKHELLDKFDELNWLIFLVGKVQPPPPVVPVRHWSFDNLDGLVLMEGTVQTHFSALMEGKVKN